MPDFQPRIGLRQQIEERRLARLNKPTPDNPVITKTNRFTTLNNNPNPAQGGGLMRGISKSLDGGISPATNQPKGDPYAIAVNRAEDIARIQRNTGASLDLARDVLGKGFSDEEVRVLAQGGTEDDVNNLRTYGRDNEGNIITNEVDYLKEQERNETALAGIRKKEIKDNLLDEEAQIRADLDRSFAPRFEAARAAGTKSRETALRLAGRSASGTVSQAQQEDLIEKERLIEESIAAEKSLQERQLIASARGASKAELDAIGNALTAARDKRVKAQEELKLRQAGLDQKALELANEREMQLLKDALDAAKSGLVFDEESGQYVSDPSFTSPEDYDFELITDNNGIVTQLRTNKSTGEVFTSTLGQIGKAASQQKKFISGTARQRAGVFDEATGEFTPVSGASISPSGGGSAGSFSGANLSTFAKEVLDNPTLIQNLTPTKRGEVLQELANAGEDLAQFTLEKVGSAQKQKIAEYDGLVREANNSLEALVGLDVGPIASRLKAGKAAIGLEPDFTIYRSSIDNLSSALLKARSGAAVTDAEFKRISGFIPQVNDDEKTAQKKIKRFKEEIEKVREDNIKRAVSTSKQLLDSINNQPQSKSSADDILSEFGIE